MVPLTIKQREVIKMSRRKSEVRVSTKDPQRIVVVGRTWVVFEVSDGYRKVVALARSSSESDQQFHVWPSHLVPLYWQRYDFVDNFSGGLARAQLAGKWFHIRPDGQPAYSQRYLFVGNFFDEKLAMARDERGYLHINKDGMPISCQRYVSVSSFDGGVALVTLKIDDMGAVIR